MYYRLNHQHADKRMMTRCLDNVMGYLQTNSVPLDLNLSHSDSAASSLLTPMDSVPPLSGELIDGNTGATALAIMGMVEVCMVDIDLCMAHLDAFKTWIHGLISMRSFKVHRDGQALKRGAFAMSTALPLESADFYDGEGYLALSRLTKHRESLYPYIPRSDAVWREVDGTVRGLDEYFIAFPERA